MLLNSVKTGVLNKMFVEDIKTLLIPEDFDTYQKDCPIDFTVYIEAEKHIQVCRKHFLQDS